MSKFNVMFRVGCAEGGGVCANVVRTDYGPTFVFRMDEESRTAFLRSDGTQVGRWALDEKHDGRLQAFPWKMSIVLREPRWYRAGERADDVDERTSGLVRAWCDGRQHHHEVDLAALVEAVQRGRSAVLVVP